MYTLPSHDGELASFSLTTTKNAAAKMGGHYPVMTHASGRLATNAASSIAPPPVGHEEVGHVDGNEGPRRPNGIGVR